MKFKLKSGDTKLKIIVEGNPNGWDKILGNLFSSFDVSKINKLYAKIPAEIINYYDEMGKALVSQVMSADNHFSSINAFNDYAMKTMEKILHVEKRSNVSSTEKANVFPTNGHDIYNYFARFGIANFQIQAILELDGNIDFVILKRAARLAAEDQPVFGCQFSEGDPPYWKQFENLDSVEFCIYEETDDIQKAVTSYIESPLDMDRDPMVKIKLIRCGDKDTLCFKVNHSCCDGTGTKEYLKLISDIYTCLENNIPFEPKPGVRGRVDQDRLFRNLNIQDPEMAWDPLLEVPKTMWKFPWTHGKPDSVKVLLHQLPVELIERMQAFGKSRGSTINDLLLTALYRTMFDISQPVYGVPMDISLTVDLRRYLPDLKTSSIRNFSGGCDTRLPRVAYENFEDTLARVTAMMNNLKNSKPGLQSAIGLERIEKMNLYDTRAYFQVATACSDLSLQIPAFNGDLCSPVLSNLGYLSKELIYFGHRKAVNAYIIPPVVRAPGILIVAGTYNGLLSLSVSYYEVLLQKNDAERLFGRITQELDEGCKISES